MDLPLDPKQIKQQDKRIKRRIATLLHNKAKIEIGITSLQSVCSHPKETLQEDHGNSANWDGDLYWTNFHCLNCEKRWHIRHN